MMNRRKCLSVLLVAISFFAFASAQREGELVEPEGNFFDIGSYPVIQSMMSYAHAPVKPFVEMHDALWELIPGEPERLNEIKNMQVQTATLTGGLPALIMTLFGRPGEALVVGPAVFLMWYIGVFLAVKLWSGIVHAGYDVFNGVGALVDSVINGEVPNISFEQMSESIKRRRDAASSFWDAFADVLGIPVHIVRGVLFSSTLFAVRFATNDVVEIYREQDTIMYPVFIYSLLWHFILGFSTLMSIAFVASNTVRVGYNALSYAVDRVAFWRERDEREFRWA